MEKNQIIDLEITDLSYEAMGVAHYNGMTVFVTNALPGEVVSAKILKVKKNFAFAKIEKIKKEPRTKYTWEHQFTLSPATKAVKEISGVDAKSEFDDAVTKAWSEVKGSEENPVYSAVCHYSCEKITPGI